jgi:hypothetical protein
VRSGSGEARTILLLHIISVRPSKHPLMVRTFLKVYMELSSYFLFLQEQIKDIIITYFLFLQEQIKDIIIIIISLQVLWSVFAGSEMRCRPKTTKRGMRTWVQNARIRVVCGGEMIENIEHRSGGDVLTVVCGQTSAT